MIRETTLLRKRRIGAYVGIHRGIALGFTTLHSPKELDIYFMFACFAIRVEVSRL
jgi:hypothetical protein